MTMLGRGKRSAADKDGKRRKDDKDPEKGTQTAAEKARAAEERARKAAEEAAEAEEEAARLAQLAAEAAEAETDDEDDEDADDAAESPESEQDAQNDAEGTSEDDEASEDESADSEGVSADTEEGDSGKKRKRREKKSETVDDDVDDEPVRSSGRRPAVLVGVLAVLAIALAAGTTFLALQVREDAAVEDARRDGVAAASHAVKALSSYDYRTLDNDLKAAEAATTGKLREEFPKFAQELKAEAKQQEAVSTTTVLKAGAVSVSPDEVVALVYANRISATNKDTQARLPEPLRVKTTMVKVDGEWKAKELQVLS